MENRWYRLTLSAPACTVYVDNLTLPQWLARSPLKAIAVLHDVYANEDLDIRKYWRAARAARPLTPRTEVEADALVARFLAKLSDI